LVINQNELETLPEEIGNLKKLRYIDMWSNNITHLPQSMTDMYALEEVDLRVIVMTQREQEDIKGILQNTTVKLTITAIAVISTRLLLAIGFSIFQSQIRSHGKFPLKSLIIFFAFTGWIVLSSWTGGPAPECAKTVWQLFAL